MKVAEMRAPSRLRLEVRAPLIRGSHVYSVNEEGGGPNVWIDARYGGLLGSVFGALPKGKVGRDLREELSSIKAQTESPST